MVNCIFDELSFQARLTSEWAYHRNTLFALRRLCCIDLRPSGAGGCCGASDEWPTGPAHRRGSPKAGPREGGRSP
jgi:hypothetical protein